MERAARWFVKALAVLVRVDDQENARIATGNYLTICRAADPALQSKLKALWLEAGLGPMPEE